MNIERGKGMTTQRYGVSQQPIATLFTWIDSGEIAIPEIQRPFVWDATKVRNFLDSLFQGYPVGYLISWRNPDVRLKDGTSSTGKRILIDGQQRVTALMTSLLAREVMNKDYDQVKIKIAFHPIDKRFEVSNPALAKDPSWIPDISVIFDPNTSLYSYVRTYCASNPGTNEDEIFRSIELLRGITSNQIGMIELAPDLDINTVTEIFIRVNSEGVPLSQADFAMSKIAVDDAHGGNLLRKAIDYFCHMAATPDFFKVVAKDRKFSGTEFFQHMAWLKNDITDLYDPSYTDMLRVAFVSEFKRGRLEDLVALLSGRNFETKQYEESIIEDSFARLKQGIDQFMNESNFKRFVMIIRSAGFVDSSMIRSQNALNSAYILYLTLRSQSVRPEEIERFVRRWYVMAVLTGRYSGSPESMFDIDIRQIHALGIQTYMENILGSELSDVYWDARLPQELESNNSSNPSFLVFKAAQVKMEDLGFLSNDIKVRDLIEIKCDEHHLFPKDFLKKSGMSRGQYNQVANYVLAQTEINIKIGNKEPRTYFSEIIHQCNGGGKCYGNITDSEKLRENFRSHCIPDGIESMTIEDYPRFLADRRKLMAQKMKTYFNML
jgi:hypothetical protein